MKRLDEKARLMGFNSIFQPIVMDLVEIDQVEANCMGIRSGLTIRRTKDPMPAFMEGYWGPLIRTVSSMDGSEEMDFTTPSAWLNRSNTTSFRYNKTRYFWFLNDYLYFPNCDWEAVKIDGVFQDDVSAFVVDSDQKCLPRQNQSINVPDYILAEVESEVVKELTLFLQTPSDLVHDKQNPDR
jgi:hypothetical protein